jgi:hypothetical protein
MDVEKIAVHLRYSLIAVGCAGLAAVATYFIWFGIMLDEPFSPDQSKWGTFGDYVGGVMNPLVAACALYWLTMSVRLQKQELAATREELELTRGELADASAAQQEQARLALLSTQISSLNLRLGSISIELNHLRTRLNYALQYMDKRGSQIIMYDIENGGTIMASILSNLLQEKIEFLSQREQAIFTELELINTLILSKHSKP